MDPNIHPHYMLPKDDDDADYGQEEQYNYDEDGGAVDGVMEDIDEDDAEEEMETVPPLRNNQPQFFNGNPYGQVSGNVMENGQQHMGSYGMAMRNQPMKGGKMRPQSAKTKDDHSLKFQQQIYPQQQPMNQGWMQQPGAQDYGQYSFNNMPSAPAFISGLPNNQAFNPSQYGSQSHSSAGFISGQNAGLKKRPTTAGRRPNNMGLQVNSNSFSNKKSGFLNGGFKNPSSLDLEVSRLRPRVINQERERLYDDALKQKMAANHLKEENIKLKTKIMMMETEMGKKEKLIDDLLQQQNESFNVANQGYGTLKSRTKVESHLSLNLKKKVREVKTELQQKIDECEMLRRNIKSTKLQEIEVEIKMYMDECTRLRHNLEEVIKSKDTFADPQEMKMIEDRFQQQDLIIQSLKNENSELAMAYTKKEDENRQLRDYIGEIDKKQKKTNGKENIKLRKQLKDKEREIIKMRDEIKSFKQMNEEYRQKIEELVKKGTTNASQFQSRPSYPQNTGIADSQDLKKLKQQLNDKDLQIKEVNSVVTQLQQKLGEKIQENVKLEQEKDKYKELYEKYQSEVARLEAMVEGGHTQPKPKSLTLANVTKEMTKSIETKKIARVEKNQIERVCLELRLKMQTKGFHSNQIKEYFFKPYESQAQISIKTLQAIFESNGVSENQALLLSRYIIEPKNQKQVNYSEDASVTQREVIDLLQDLIGHYIVYSGESLKSIHSRLTKCFASCKGTVKETLQLEDYEEEGVLTWESIKEALNGLEIDGLDDELMDYILLIMYTKSESLSKLNYRLLFDALDNENAIFTQNSKKRPESSSPQKLKARNKDKFNKQDERKDTGDDDYEQEEFENIVKDDDEQANQDANDESNDLKDEDEDEMDLDEEKMLDIAESCFVRLAESLLEKNLSIRQAFSTYIVREQLDEDDDNPAEILELLSPVGFLEGLKDLGITELSEIEIACLMRVLTKPELENAILIKELQLIMENFGIQEEYDGGKYEGGVLPKESQEINGESKSEFDQSKNEENQKKEGKKKKKGGAGAQADLSQLDEKSIKIMAKLMLALMELDVSLYDFFEGAIFDQLVKTKTKQNTVEIIKGTDFFAFLQARGVRKNNNIHDNLLKFLQLDPNYPQLIMVKKIVKALDEMAKNDELMAGIMAAAEGEDENVAGDGKTLGTVDEEENQDDGYDTRQFNQHADNYDEDYEQDQMDEEDDEAF